MFQRFVHFILILCCFCLFSCRQNTKTLSDKQKNTAILKSESILNALSFRVFIDREELEITEELTLTIQANAPEEYLLTFPEFGKDLEQFSIVDYYTETPQLNEDQTISYERTFILEPLFAEIYKIPEMEISFEKIADETAKHKIKSEEFEIKVILPPKELWDEENFDPDKDLHPTDKLVSVKDKANYHLYIVLFVLIALAIFVYIKKKKKQVVQEFRIPPHIKAFAELQRLIDEKLLEKQELQLFYLKISAIVRVYIEEQFDIKAPELTTEEFLQILADEDNDSLTEYRKLLKDFLSHCDMVKFAQYKPDKNEIEKTITACKNFIKQSSTAYSLQQ